MLSFERTGLWSSCWEKNFYSWAGFAQVVSNAFCIVSEKVLARCFKIDFLKIWIELCHMNNYLNLSLGSKYAGDECNRGRVRLYILLLCQCCFTLSHQNESAILYQGVGLFCMHICICVEHWTIPTICYDSCPNFQWHPKDIAVQQHRPPKWFCLRSLWILPSGQQYVPGWPSKKHDAVWVFPWTRRGWWVCLTHFPAGELSNMTSNETKLSTHTAHNLSICNLSRMLDSFKGIICGENICKTATF